MCARGQGGGRQLQGRGRGDPRQQAVVAQALAGRGGEAAPAEGTPVVRESRDRRDRGEDGVEPGEGVVDLVAQARARRVGGHPFPVPGGVGQGGGGVGQRPGAASQGESRERPRAFQAPQHAGRQVFAQHGAQQGLVGEEQGAHVHRARHRLHLGAGVAQLGGEGLHHRPDLGVEGAQRFVQPEPDPDRLQVGGRRLGASGPSSTIDSRRRRSRTERAMGPTTFRSRSANEPGLGGT